MDNIIVGKFYRLKSNEIVVASRVYNDGTTICDKVTDPSQWVSAKIDDFVREVGPNQVRSYIKQHFRKLADDVCQKLGCDKTKATLVCQGGKR